MGGANGYGESPRRADVAIVGAGVAGLCAARAALGLGLEAVLVASDRPAASEVAAGMIAPVGELSWGEEELHRAAVAASRAWPEFAKRLESDSGSTVPYRRCGALHVALDRDEAAELRRHAELITGHGLPVEPLTRSAARGLESALSPGVAAALLAPDEAEIDPRALLDALRDTVDGAVATVSGQVAKIDVGDGRVSGVTFDHGGRIATDRVVVAAGAWSGELLGARAPRVRPVKGEILRLRPRRDQELPCERIIVTDRVYLVPRSTGELLVGATVEEHGFDLTVTAGGVHELLREAYRVIPETAEMELADIAVGLRPGSPDNAPLLGPTGTVGLILATGGYRSGILLAPLIGPAVAAALSGADAPAETAPFGPDRRSAEAPA